MNVGELIEELKKYPTKTSIEMITNVNYLDKCFCCSIKSIAKVEIPSEKTFWLEICGDCDEQNTVPILPE